MFANHFVNKNALYDKLLDIFINMNLKVISDGTETGTKLINADTGEMIHGVSKITVCADCTDQLVKTTVEYFNIPVEITTVANVDLFDNNHMNIGVLNKKIKLLANKDNNYVLSSKAKIIDEESNAQMGGITLYEFEATPKQNSTKIKQIIHEKI